MTTMIRRAGRACFALLACLVLPALSSCNARHMNGGTDSTTHWLERCDLDEDCGQLRCLCGRCSDSCGDDDACARFGSSARCEATAESCASVSLQAMCVAPCEASADCAEIDHGQCRDGQCVSDPSDRPAPDASVNIDPLDASGDAAALDASTDAARDAAGPPLGSCGEPAYRCPPGCHGPLTLRGGKRQQQPCVDDCRFELTIRPESTDFDAPCTPPLAQLSIQGVDNDYRDRSATLSDEAWSELGRLSEYLDTQGLWPMSCSDCMGVRSASVTVPGIDQFESDLSYRSDAVPAWLSEADAFVQALIDQLTVCEGPLIRDCKDATPAPGPDEPLPTVLSCAFTYTNQELAAVSCSMPVHQSEPCRAAVVCMCNAGLLQPGPSDPQFCEESWLTPRGAITFRDFCGDGPADATRTLGEALQLFADAYQDEVVVTPECEQLPAYF